LEIGDYIIKENISGKELLEVSIIKYIEDTWCRETFNCPVVVLDYRLTKDSTKVEEFLVKNLIRNKELGGIILPYSKFLSTFNTESFTILKIEQDGINLNN